MKHGCLDQRLSKTRKAAHQQDSAQAEDSPDRDQVADPVPPVNAQEGGREGRANVDEHVGHHQRDSQGHEQIQGCRYGQRPQDGDRQVPRWVLCLRKQQVQCDSCRVWPFEDVEALSDHKTMHRADSSHARCNGLDATSSAMLHAALYLRQSYARQVRSTRS